MSDCSWDRILSVSKSNFAPMQAIVLTSIAVVTFTLGMIPFKLVAKMKDNQDHETQARYFTVCFIDPDYLCTNRGAGTSCSWHFVGIIIITNIQYGFEQLKFWSFSVLFADGNWRFLSHLALLVAFSLEPVFSISCLRLTLVTLQTLVDCNHLVILSMVL